MQISVAHARERPADFCAFCTKQKSTPATWGGFYSPLCFGCGVWVSLVLLTANAPPQVRHWVNGMGVVGDNPAQKPLGTGARKGDLILRAVVRE